MAVSTCSRYIPMAIVTNRFLQIFKWKSLKQVIVAILFCCVVIFSYIRLTHDWCIDNDDRCCQINRNISYRGNVKTASESTVLLSSISSALKLTYANMKEYVTSGVLVEEVEFLLNSRVCGDGHLYLTAVVTSKPSNVHQRQAIRETWGSQFNMESKLRLVFLTGIADNITNQQLAKEQQEHFDVVQADFTDTYKNLTLKTVSMLQWKKQFCRKTRFLLKIDDMFLQTDNLLSRLNVLRNEKRFILGFLGIDEEPYRNSSNKWYVSYEDYPFDQFPMFVHGPSYVISSDLVDDLYNTARHKSRIHLEDVHVTGLSAHVVRATLVGPCGFAVGSRDTDIWHLSDLVITAHEYSPDNLKALWRHLNAGKRWLPFWRLYGKIVGF